MTRCSSRRPALPLLMGLLALAPLPAAAQRTHDEARLVIGVAGGWIGGQPLWVVGKQPFATEVPGNIDTVGLTRRLSSNITVSAQGVYFPRPHIGYAGEFTYIGLGTTDACTVKSTYGSPLTSGSCNALNGLNRSASTVALLGGLYYRFLSNTAYQPYLKGLAGASLVPRSTANVDVAWGPDLENITDFYVHTGSKELRPTGVLAFGIATAPSNGYQLRVEFREVWVQLPVVTGPTAYQGLTPAVKTAWKHLPNFSIGFDIVLERRRGRRY